MFTEEDTIIIYAIEAKNLKAMDRNGKSDPFCVVGASAQTDVQKNTLNPKWSTYNTIYYSESQQFNIPIKIYDWNRFSKNVLMEECVLKPDVSILNKRTIQKIELSQGTLEVEYAIVKKVAAGQGSASKESTSTSDSSSSTTNVSSSGSASTETTSAKIPITIEEARKIMLSNNVTELDKYDLASICNRTYKSDTGVLVTLVGEAVLKDMEEMLHYLLSIEKIDPNEGQYTSPLYRAVEGENENIVRMLINHPKVDVNHGVVPQLLRKDPAENETPLTRAIERSKYNYMKLLLDHPKIDLNRGSQQETALSTAAQRNDVEAAKLLLTHPKADVNFSKKGTFLASSVLYAACLNENGLEMVKLLVQHKVKIDYYAFVSAIKNKYLDIVKYLLVNGADCYEMLKMKTPFDIAVENGLNLTQLKEEALKEYPPQNTTTI